MSLESVNAFLAEARSNTDLAGKLAGLQGSRDSAVDQVQSAASEAGFSFTGSEYESVIKDRFKASHAAKLLGPEEIAKMWGHRASDEISEDGTCSWFECQGTGDHCGSEKTCNTDPQTGC